MDGGEVARRMMRCGDNAFLPKSIMMRFRPIAPKPITGCGSSIDGKNTLISKGRTKRKYVRVRRYNRKKKTASMMITELDPTQTLQLLPERHDGSGSPPAAENQPIWKGNDIMISDPREEIREGRVGGELWVTVELVTDACMNELGCTDEGRKKNLEEDTCPGFISDGLNRVEWLNKAFKRMVKQRQRKGINGNEYEEIVIWFLTKPRLGDLSKGFTCQIKLRYKWGEEMDKDSKVVPCDVWRMDGGGFAWKLDVKAALTLGPSDLYQD